MAFNMADQKLRNRRVLHRILAVPAVYEGGSVTVSEGLTVRWGNKLVKAGALDNNFSVEIIEGIDRLIFSSEQLAGLGLKLESQAIITIPQYDCRFSLESLEPGDGPLNIYWQVARLGADQ